MEKYNLHMRRDVFEQVTNYMITCAENNEWLTVKALGDLIEADLSTLFGSGNLGWSPSTLRYRCQATATVCAAWVSMPRPEEIPVCHNGCTVRDCMEELASLERPTLDEWLSKNGIGNGAQLSEKVYMQNTLAILRRMVENRHYVRPEFIVQLSEMRTLIHALIGTGETCCAEPENECPEDVHKANRLDAMDAFSYAVRAMLGNKDKPGVKEALNSFYRTAVRESTRLSDALERAASASMAGLRDAVCGSSENSGSALIDSCECENVCAKEPPALFVTIETGMLEVTPENAAAVSSFITNVGEGRDIHLRII